MDRMLVAPPSPRKRLWSSRRDSIKSAVSAELFLPNLISHNSSPSKSRDAFVTSLIHRVVSKDDQCLALIYKNCPETGCFCQPFLGSPAFGSITSIGVSDGSVLVEKDEFNRKSRNSKPTANATLNTQTIPVNANINTSTSPQRYLDTKHVPIEIFEQIILLLSRRDVKQMRLVSRDWEYKVARSIFRSVVVPFSTDIYGMLGKSMPESGNISSKAKVVPRTGSEANTKTSACLHLESETVQAEDTFDMFGGFGPHMRHFGISFEVDSNTLSNPPPKNSQRGHDSYWGNYVWPAKGYQRFADRAGLEVTADETATMTKAFAKLSDVSQLALAVNSGLGHIHGPDLSLRARIIAETPEVFGHSHFEVEPKVRSKRQLWEKLESIFHRGDSAGHFRCAEIARIGTAKDEFIIKQLMQENYKEPWYQVEPELVMNSAEELLVDPAADLCNKRLNHYDSLVPRIGILLIKVSVKRDKKFDFSRSIAPNSLTNAQQEWLLETAWAQDAFLSSYMLSITDNAEVFQSVAHLNISRISSRHLDKLCRQDFWDSLPGLSTFEIKVIADWRDVQKDETGAANTPTITPSAAVDCFRTLITKYVSLRKSIKTLSIGWVNGGEHAEGMKQRNKNLLPAIFTSRYYLTRVDENSLQDMLILPFVENFRITNCWVTPNALRVFLTHHSELRMTNVTLDSVSMTAHPRFPRPGAAVAGVLAFTNLIGTPLHQLQHLNLSQLGAAAYFAGLPLPQGATAGVPPFVPAGGGILPFNIPQNYALNAAGAAPVYIHAYPGPARLYNALLNHLNLPGQGLGQVAGFNNTGSLGPIADPNREGSWPEVLCTLDRALSYHNTSSKKSFDDNGNEEFSTKLAHPLSRLNAVTLHLHSVGYVRLRSCDFDQSAFDHAEAASRQSEQYHDGSAVSSYFELRREALSSITMHTNDEWLGSIVCALPYGEMQSMIDRWGPDSVWEGWPAAKGTTGDEDGLWGRWGEKTADASRFDGEPKGGTGRFSGMVVLGGVDRCSDGWNGKH